MTYLDYMHVTTAPPSMAFLGLIAGIGGALLGGLGAKKQAKKVDAANQARAEAMEEAAKVPLEVQQDTYHTVHLDRLNKEAIENGYNPYTILMAGGLSAYTQTTNYSKTTGHNAMAAAEGSNPAPTAPNGMQIAGNVMTTFANGVNSMAASSAGALSSFPSAPRGGFSEAVFGTPAFGRAAGGGMQAVVTSPLSSKAKSGALGQPMAPTLEAPTIINPHRNFNSDPTVPGASAWEEEYGDILGVVGGVNKAFANVMYNVTGRTEAQRWAKTKADWESTKAAVMSTGGAATQAGTNLMDSIRNAVGTMGSNAKSWFKTAPAH